MYKIKGQLGKRQPETIDRATTAESAEYLRGEYRLAFGPKWKIWVMESKEQKNLDVIKLLREAGKTNSEIAASLKLKTGTVNMLARKLVNQGLVARRKPGQVKKITIAKRNEQIAKMVEDGKQPKEIAVELKLRHQTVRCIVHNMRASGRLPRVTV